MALTGTRPEGRMTLARHPPSLSGVAATRLTTRTTTQRKPGPGEGARKSEGASLPTASARGSEGQAPWRQKGGQESGRWRLGVTAPGGDKGMREGQAQWRLA